ncbi:MAG TPA: ferrochelatase [Casimicrobium huifangae]|uniref:ferrochelatase n=1 Tax=Casimicrobium huifangae TaxID=2591109 RepID=UPI0012EC5AC2|nr:ferrochelatase [Casimicrobium huifangae]HOB01738.1 ferrochelatase [Casimicrobium huifangae]HQA34339.1 ferrochelatase [Casimicrobium huifangae]
MANSQFTHGQPPRIGILLVNLGTPDAPTPAAVRRYLAEFLSDRRVVEIPPMLWKLILHGIILRTRPAKSAKKYASIWTPDGSPLMVWTQRQAQYLRGSLGERLKGQGLPPDLVQVEVGMRYGNPSIASALAKLKAARCDRILLLPMYPQYAASTTATACDAVFKALMQDRSMPALRTIASWHDDPAYIKALAARVNGFWKQHGRPDKLIMSFHGVPKFTLTKGDPYHCLCHKTARLLARELGLTDGQWQLTFQSRFGRAEWLQPYTDATLQALPAQGIKRVHVVCPGFPSDCLETLEEIAIEGKETFLHAGGQSYDYIPALNDHPALIQMLTDLAINHMQGWWQAPPDTTELVAQTARARALGATA